MQFGKPNCQLLKQGRPISKPASHCSISSWILFFQNRRICCVSFYFSLPFQWEWIKNSLRVAEPSSGDEKHQESSAGVAE
jgi:hypothetical protein